MADKAALLKVSRALLQERVERHRLECEFLASGTDYVFRDEAELAHFSAELGMLEELGIAGFFRQIGGASMDAARDTKTAVIRSLLSLPALDGMRVLMVGDRADDMAGAAECFLPAAAAAYGYGAPAEWEPFCPVYVAKDCRALTQFVLDGEMI